MKKLTRQERVAIAERFEQKSWFEKLEIMEEGSLKEVEEKAKKYGLLIIKKIDKEIYRAVHADDMELFLESGNDNKFTTYEYYSEEHSISGRGYINWLRGNEYR